MSGHSMHGDGRDDSPTVFSYPLQPDLLAEADHRIANNLALLSGMVRIAARRLARSPGPVPAGVAVDVLDGISAKIDAVSRLHRLLSTTRAQGEVAVGPFLEEVCHALGDSIAGLARQLTCVADAAGAIEARRALPLALLICEFVTNAAKYAHPTGMSGRIAVVCRSAADDTLDLEVQDDGVGLPDGFDPAVDGGMGFVLIRRLVEQLAARADYVSTPLGLTVRVRVPRA